MHILKSAITICQHAEKQLQELMQQAIGAGEYRDLPVLARLTEQMNQAAARLEENPGPPATPASHPAPAAAASARPLARSRRKVRTRQQRQAKPPARSVKREYPKFRREGDTLVKMGWSKSNRSEYEHRAPKRAAKALLMAIGRNAGRMPVFTVDALLPLADSGDGSEIPGYQVYLALAWLRKEGIVRQHGRRGYSLLVKSDLDTLLEERWKALPDPSPARTENLA